MVDYAPDEYMDEWKWNMSYYTLKVFMVHLKKHIVSEGCLDTIMPTMCYSNRDDKISEHHLNCCRCDDKSKAWQRLMTA